MIASVCKVIYSYSIQFYIFSMLKTPVKAVPLKKPLNIIKKLFEPKTTHRTLKVNTCKSISTIQNDFSTTQLSKHSSTICLMLQITVDKPQHIVKLTFSYSSQTLIAELIAFLKAQLSQTQIYFKTNDLSIEYLLTLPHRKVQELEQQKLELNAVPIKIDKNGHRLKDLEIIKCLGTGGFSKVYLVRGYGKLMAMKVINKAFILNNEKQSIVQSERTILQKCKKHPFITQLDLSFQTRDYLIFCMEYCNGGQLFNLLRKVRRMKEEEAKFYFLQTLAAISHLHSQNILYRDLKPQNIMLDSQGHIRLADYGLSKVMRESMTYSFCGSAEYMAPEMLLKTGHGFEMDYYCLGGLFYQLLIGLPPYYSRNQKQLFNNILNQQLQFPPGIPFSEDVKIMLRGLLQKNTELRFKNIQEIFSSPYLQDYNLEDILAKKLTPPFSTNMFENNFDNGDFIESEKIQMLKLSKQRDLGRLPEEEAYFPYFEYMSDDLVRLQEQIIKSKLKKLNFSKKPSAVLQTNSRKQISWRNTQPIKSIDNSQFLVSQHQALNSPRFTSNYDKFKVFSSQTSQILKQSNVLKAAQMSHNTTPTMKTPLRLLSPQKEKDMHSGNKRFSSPNSTTNYQNFKASRLSSQLSCKLNEYPSPQGKKLNINSSTSSFKNNCSPSTQTLAPLISPSQSATNLQKNIYLQKALISQGYLSNFKQRFNPNQKIKKSYKANERCHLNFFAPNTPYKS